MEYGVAESLEYYDDDSPTLIVMSYDPGVTVGWAVHRAPIDSLITMGFKGTVSDARFAWCAGAVGSGRSEDECVDVMVDLMREAYVLGDYSREKPDKFVVVMEDFIPRMFAQDRAFLSPVRVFSKFERDLYKMNRDLDFQVRYVKQSSSDALSIVSDARLKTWNLYRPGSIHARDAQKHGVLACRKFASGLLRV